MKYSLLLSFSLLALLLSGTASAFFCSTPSGNGFINVGDSSVKVIETCGQPSSIQYDQPGAPQLNTTQYISYSNQTSHLNRFAQTGTPDTTLKNMGPPVVFQVVNGKVAKIYVSGKDIQSTNKCPSGAFIRVGDSADKVNSCGTPTDTKVDHSSKANKLEVWTYNYGANHPSLILKFSQGKLTHISQGR